MPDNRDEVESPMDLMTLTITATGDEDYLLASCEEAIRRIKRKRYGKNFAMGTDALTWQIELQLAASG